MVHNSPKRFLTLEKIVYSSKKAVKFNKGF
uniref:Uncharacterized protein n=1 Tax=Anguilla anguilla TaxID=7936 RepID=A0A0E9SUN4_ANGAN